MPPGGYGVKAVVPLPIKRDGPSFAMTDALLTIDTLVTGAPAPGLLRLRVLDRELSDRIARLDARVETLLRDTGDDWDDAVSEIDVLCAAMTELIELRDEARRHAAAELAARRARRRGARRWR